MDLGAMKNPKKASKPSSLSNRIAFTSTNDSRNINALQMSNSTTKNVKFDNDSKCCICNKPTDFLDPNSSAFCCSMKCLQELTPLAAKQEREKKDKKEKKKDKKDKKGIKKSDEKKKEKKEKKKKKKEKEREKKLKRKKSESDTIDKEKELVSGADSSTSSEDGDASGTGMNVENDKTKTENREIRRITKNINNQIYIVVERAKEKLIVINKREQGVEKVLSVITVRQELIGEYIRLSLEYVTNLKAKIPELLQLELVGTIGDINISIRESFQLYMSQIASSLNDVAKSSDNIIADLKSVQDIITKASERVVELYMRYDEEWVKSKQVFIDGYLQSSRWGSIIQAEIKLINDEFSYFYLQPLTEFEDALSVAPTYDRIREDRKKRKRERKLAKKKKAKKKAEKEARKKRNAERRKKGDERSRSSSESESDDSVIVSTEEEEEVTTSSSSNDGEEVYGTDDSLTETDEEEIGAVEYYDTTNRRTLPERATKQQITPKRKIDDVIRPVIDNYDALRKWFSDPIQNDMIDYVIDMILIISRDVTEANVHNPDIITKYYKALEVMFFTITINDKVSFLQDLINVVYLGLGTLEAGVEKKTKKSKKEKGDDGKEKEDAVKKVDDLSDNPEVVLTYAKYIFGIVHNGLEANPDRGEWDIELSERRKLKKKLDDISEWKNAFLKVSKEIIHQYYVMKLENIEVTNNAIRIISDSDDAAITDDQKLLDIVTKGELYAYIMDRLIVLMQLTGVLSNAYRLDLQYTHLEEEELDDDGDDETGSVTSSSDDDDTNSASGEESEDSSFSL